MHDIVTIFDLDNLLKTERLNGKWKKIHSISVFQSEILIFYTHDCIEEAKQSAAIMLEDNFFNDGDDDFVLVNKSKIPVVWCEEAEGTKPIPYNLQPLLQDSALLDNPEQTAIDESFFNYQFELEDTDPQLIAFFSFKGGVGRTMHMTALAQYLADKIESTASSPKILLIDADTEAPGITWWIEEMERRYSYLDFLGEASLDENQAVEKAAGLIKTMRPELGTPARACYFLPAFRNREQLIRPPAVPSQLTAQRGNQWLLGDILLKLGKTLGVKYIFVDLRAGLTELSSPLLLDPRVVRFFVTSASRQSIRGTQISLETFGRFAKLFPPGIRNNYADKTQLILGFSLDDNASKNSLSELEAGFNVQLRDIFHAGDDDSREWCLRSYFDGGLLNLGTFKESLEKFENTSRLVDLCREMAQSFLAKKDTLEKSDAASFSIDDLNKLREFAENLIFAENQAKTAGFLVIDSYRQLATRFLAESPSAVVVGSKGSGKTFFLKTLAGIRTWKAFCEKCGLDGSDTADIPMIPLLWSINDDKDSFVELQTESLSALGCTWDTDKSNKLTRMFQDEFYDVSNKPNTEWREKWLRVFCFLFGIKTVSGKSCESKLKNYLESIEKPAVFLIDGLEDLFSDWIKPNASIKPLSILLQEIIRDMNKWSRGRIGLLVFIRKDLVQSAIQQNSEQFLSLYKNYELRWSKEEALRLVGWVLTQAEITQFIRIPDSNWTMGGYDDLEKNLHPLWGAKMGTQKSREANSAGWILSAISDFKGNFQARDIIRLLSTSAKLQLAKGQIPSDRMLSPAVLRDAMVECGEQKIGEIVKEIPAISKELNVLKNGKPSIPITREKLEELGINKTALLEELGIFFRDGDQYYLPEIYRRGLGIVLDMGARPQVVSLMRKALAKAGL